MCVANSGYPAGPAVDYLVGSLSVPVLRYPSFKLLSGPLVTNLNEFGTNISGSGV